MVKSDKRRDPFKSKSGEPVEDLGLTRPAALDRLPSKGRRPPRPAEKRRRARFVGVTFSNEIIPDRLRALALEWDLLAADGQSPAVSALVEALLLPQLEAAERGEIERPTGI